MSELQQIQNLLKEISEALSVETKASKKKAIFKLRAISTISNTLALTLEMKK